MSARWQDLRQRTISGVVLGFAILFITWWDAVSFDIIVLLAAYVLLCEWLNLTRTRHALWILFGMVYLALACYSLALTRHIYGWEATFLLFALVWIGDVAAYFVGKRFGNHKIAPSISPGKSWGGLAGSLIATMGLSVCILSIWKHYESVNDSLLIGALFSLIGLAGDLFESWMKRQAGVKDSGTVIPGHGGLFDRVDALLPCSILAALLLFF